MRRAPASSDLVRAVCVGALLVAACGGSSGGDLFGGQDGGASDGGETGECQDGGQHCLPRDACVPSCVSKGCGAGDGCGGTCSTACMCGGAACAGCCTRAGACAPGTTNDACGNLAGACESCGAGTSCVAGLCRSRGADAGTSCEPTNDCPSAQDMGSLSGDAAAGTGTIATGTISTWLKVGVLESDQGILGIPLRVTATLTSPPDANFDLFLYVDESGLPTARACGPTPQEASTNASGTDTVTHSWGESTIANNLDDSRIVSIEVRHVSGACAGAGWSLTVKGD